LSSRSNRRVIKKENLNNLERKKRTLGRNVFRIGGVPRRRKDWGKVSVSKKFCRKKN